MAVIVPELLPVPPVRGGAVEYWVHETCSRMKRPGRRIAVISRPAGIAGEDGIEYIGIPWTTLERFFRWIKERVTWKNPLRFVAKIQNVVSYGMRVARAVGEFDFIYLHNDPNLLLFLRKRAGQKIVLHMHNNHLSSKQFRPIYRMVLAKTDRVLCVSDHVRQCAMRSFPEFADRFQVVLNATNPEVFRPYGDEARQALDGIVELKAGYKHVLYVGRLTPLKGVHVLIEAFRNVHRQIPKTRLIITGSSFFEGATRTAYEKKLAKLARPLRDTLIFTGYLPHEKLKYLYSAADVVALPSVWHEPFGLVMLEAMAAGTCLVASSVGGIPEIVHSGKNGLLVEPRDAQALSEAICSLLSEDRARRRMEEVARAEVIARFSWERLVGEIEEILGELQ